jgi:predicted AAA+ superfamily ATPase
MINMDERFAPHNSHLEDADSFEFLDPNLRRLRGQPLVYHSPLLKSLPDVPGIYTVTGGRQVGKTTLLKQWMARLLADGTPPFSIFYLTGELIDDHHTLVRLITDLRKDSLFPAYLLVDEVTYIRQWDRGVKYLADAGLLDDIILLLTGSDMVIINEARMRFPGRRGRAGKVDFHLYPLSFGESIRLKGILDDDQQQMLRKHAPEPPAEVMRLLFKGFEEYLIHGGFLTAMNDLAAHGEIQPATIHTYSDWIRGDVLKRGRQEHYLREVVAAIIRRYCSQITWNNLLADMSIDHPKTVADYVQLLVSMDAAFIQPALQEEKLRPAPKKARKLMFTDPFIFHAMNAWVTSGRKNNTGIISNTLADPVMAGRLAESCAVNHCRKFYPTFYIKAGGEVDIACVDGNRFWPVEVKWTGQLRPADLKQICKYPNGRIWSRKPACGKICGLPTVPLPLALYQIDGMDDFN